MITSPEFRIAGSSLDEFAREQVWIAIVNGSMRPVGDRDEIVRIENARVAVRHVSHCHRDDVVNGDGLVNFVPVDSQVATVVPDDDLVTQVPPFSRPVECLVEVTVVTESLSPNNPPEGKILEAFFESRKTNQFRIRPGEHQYWVSVSSSGSYPW